MFFFQKNKSDTRRGDDDFSAAFQSADLRYLKTCEDCDIEFAQSTISNDKEGAERTNHRRAAVNGNCANARRAKELLRFVRRLRAHVKHRRPPSQSVSNTQPIDHKYAPAAPVRESGTIPIQSVLFE